MPYTKLLQTECRLPLDKLMKSEMLGAKVSRVVLKT